MAVSGLEFLIEQGKFVSFEEYSFIFRDIYYPLSVKLSNIGTMRTFFENLPFSGSKFPNISPEEDIFLIGSIKTLLPYLVFKGDDILFSIFIFVITPENKKFPICLYYGPTRLAIGGWKKTYFKFTEKLIENINCDPFDLSKEEIGQLTRSLELALKKFRASDFYAIYSHDYGYFFMGIVRGKPIVVELGEEPNIEEVKLLLNARLKLNIDKKVFKKWDLQYFGE